MALVAGRTQWRRSPGKKSTEPTFGWLTAAMMFSSLHRNLLRQVCLGLEHHQGRRELRVHRRREQEDVRDRERAERVRCVADYCRPHGRCDRQLAPADASVVPPRNPGCRRRGIKRGGQRAERRRGRDLRRRGRDLSRPPFLRRREWECSSRTGSQILCVPPPISGTRPVPGYGYPYHQLVRGVLVHTSDPFRQTPQNK